MKRVLFILSHHCSGSDELYKTLDESPKIQGFRSGNVYENRQSMMHLTERPHKLDDASAIYMDELLENFQIAQKTIYEEPKLVFFIREPQGTLKEMVETHKMDLSRARNYYTLRLARLVSIARRARQGILLTYDQFCEGKGGDLIAKYLRLKGLEFEAQPKKYDHYSPVEAGAETINSYHRTIHAMESLGIMVCPVT